MKSIIKKIAIYLAILIVGGVIGAFVVASVLDEKMREINRHFARRCFSDWYGTAWHAYYDDDPQIALWALETVLKYYEEEYPLRDLPDGEGAYDLDIVRMYTKAAILFKAKGDMVNYKKYIDSALAVSKASEDSFVKKFQTEEDLLDYQKKWEESLAKRRKEKHNKTLNRRAQVPGS